MRAKDHWGEVVQVRRLTVAQPADEAAVRSPLNGSIVIRTNRDPNLRICS